MSLCYEQLLKKVSGKVLPDHSGHPCIVQGQQANAHFLDNGEVIVQYNDSMEDTQIFQRELFNEFILSSEIVLTTSSKNERIHLNSSTAEQRQAQRKKKYVESLILVGKPGSRTARQKVIDQVSVILNDYSPPTPSALYRWYRQYINSGLGAESCFANKYGERGPYTATAITDLALTIFDDHFLRKDGKSVTACYEEFKKAFEARKAAGDEDFQCKPPSKSTFYQWKDCMLTEEDIVSARLGRRARSEFKRSVLKKFNLGGILERVEMDAVTVNIGITDEQGNVRGPLLIYVAIDCYSRAIMGYHIQVGKGESTSGYLHCIQHAFGPKELSQYQETQNPWPVYGVPSSIVVDAGSAVTSKNMLTYVQHLKTDLAIAQSGKGWKKPFIERWFGTLRTSFLSQLPGYVGKRTDVKQTEQSMAREATLTIHEFDQLLNKFIVDDYHQRMHTGIGMPPIQLWNAELLQFPVSIPSSLEQLRWIRGETLTRKLHRQGIQINKIWYNSTELHKEALRIGGYSPSRELVVQYDTEDVGTITVILPDEKVLEVMSVGYEVYQGMPLSELREHNKAATKLAREERNVSTITETELLQNIKKRKLEEERERKRSKSRRAVMNNIEVNSTVSKQKAVIAARQQEVANAGSSQAIEAEIWDDLEIDDMEDFNVD